MKSIKLVCLLVSVSILTLASCSKEGDSGNELVSKERTPIVMTKSMQDVHDKSQDFSIELFKIVVGNKPQDNSLISPFSIAGALSMTMLGAENSTYEAMASTLGLGCMDMNAVSEYFGTLSDVLVNADPSVKLSLANSVWLSESVKMNKSFSNLVVKGFNAEAYTLKRFEDVNSWCKKKTCGMVDKIVGADDMDAAVMLVNALYFNGLWKDSFKIQDTKSGIFHNADGMQAKVSFMNRSFPSRAYSSDKLSAVSLPFGNETFSFTLIKPENSIEEAVNNLSPELLKSILAGNVYRNVNLSLPKMNVTCNQGDALKQVLKSMGMEIAFTPMADFSGMLEKENVFIGNVRHCVKFNIDEKGAEAAASTAVNMIRGSSGVPERLDINLDSPFIYIITEYSTGAVLFIGVQNRCEAE